ncbi:protease pro-enzyme activation domain-containing protein [Streptacidiphilus sp. P02-A3a]|uniref:S53 family peptidase n=1 Tax=Streptacidiphilus sp. P02-A3a TaxID=2704468 RepID=UPI0015F9281E|nr:S53 family peptidase [Streptacidiphilus sp. P02-A3a]QMU70833.1 S8/S53 family peptidase [Streptacidiphilus sp. P02-A3a]
MKLPLRYAIGLLAAPLPILALAVVPAQAAPTPGAATVALRADTVPAVAQSTLVGAVSARTSVSVTVSLAQRDPAGLQAFLKQVADPASAQYKHYLTVKQFAQRFGAAPGAAAQVSAYLTGHGLKVGQLTSNGLTLSATGTAAQIEKAFGTTLGTYRDRTGRQFYANTAAPVLPTAIAAVVTDVSGLSDYAVSHQNAVSHQSAVRGQSGAKASIQGYTPTQIRTGYNLNSAISAGYTGKGETVALEEFSAFTQSDVNTYDKKFSLTPSTPTVVKSDGGTTDTSGEDEVELDIEVVQAIAPGATIKVYEAPNSDAGEAAVYAQLVSNDVPIISTSWGQDEAAETASNRVALNTDFQEAAAQGQSIYAASGDDGSDDAGDGGTSVDFPAADPYVTGAGGTTLNLSSSGAWSSETAWSGSGGGVSSYFATPSFQTSVNSGSYRSVPDVAADADPDTGWAIYTEGSWAEYGGTSAAAPNWAAFTAIYDDEAGALSKAKLGFANASIYSLAESSSYKSAFHDITSGSNGAYNAGTGYDKVTGWGSYNGANFLSDELG